jgi:hypothetical protein
MVDGWSTSEQGARPILPRLLHCGPTIRLGWIRGTLNFITLETIRVSTKVLAYFRRNRNSDEIVGQFRRNFDVSTSILFDFLTEFDF